MMNTASNNRSNLQLRNNRKKPPQIRTSHIILGMLGCVIAGTLLLFGSSLFFFMKSPNANTINGVNNNNNDPIHDHPVAAAAGGANNVVIVPSTVPPQNSLRRAASNTDTQATTTTRTTLGKVTQEFYDRYGGESAANALLAKTITTFGTIESTAERILRSVARQEAFVMGFAGYSITVGRGNFFNQSFPFVVERVLKDSMKAVGVPNFIVRNSAIGGIPSFPYAYCLDHFVSRETDILSWDFSMNEMSKDPAVFEAYIRQALHQLPKRPMIIMVDNNKMRTKVLEDYVAKGLLEGAMTVAKADTVIDADLLKQPDEQKPRGLQQWEEFGAPNGCPGKGAWHPKMREHEFMGWMISMHFVKALERVYEIQQQNPSGWKTKYTHVESKALVVFPNPLSTPPNNDKSVTEILFGHKMDDNQYHMKELSCRTNFLPATDYDKVLQTLAVSGISEKATAANIMDVRSDDTYKDGWVLDVSQVERDTKRKVEKCGGLGYIDMKIALYGIPESGPLGLFLPYEAKAHDHDHDMVSTEHKDAQHWFDGVIICEANDKRPAEACQLDQDIEYVVGGIRVTTVAPINGAGEYLKRKTCVSVGVPEGAQISTRQIIGTDGSTQDSVGLDVHITAKSKVTRNDGACCLSHVVWEQH